MSKQRNLEIDLNLIEENAPVAPTADAAGFVMHDMSYASPGFVMPGYTPMDATTAAYVLEQASLNGSPPYMTAQSPVYMDPPLLGLSYSQPYVTPTYATPTFLTTGVGGGAPNCNVFGTPDVYGTPLGFPVAETPAYSAPHNYYHQREPHIAVSCRVHNVVKRVRGYCLKNGIPLIKVVDGPNVLKISVRSVLHTQKLETALKKIVTTDGIKVEAVSLPESIDVTKRKRGFLLFMNLQDFAADEAQVRRRFDETGLDYKITVVDGLTHSTRAKPVKTGVETLMKEVQLLKLEVERLKNAEPERAEA